MSRYRLASRAYPAAYWEENGPEILDVANEASGEGWSLRQAVSLVAGGLRRRAREATNSSPRQVWEIGVRTALFIWLVSGAAAVVARGLGLPWAPQNEEAGWQLYLPVVLVAAVLISTRWWVALLITFAQVRSIWLLWNEPLPGGLRSGMVLSGLVIACFVWWLALATDGRRAAGPIAGLVALSIGLGWWWALLSEGVAAMLAIAVVLTLILLAVVAAASDPRASAALAVLAIPFAVASLPFAVANSDAGWNYWAPIIGPVGFVAVPALATWLGSRRLARA